MTVTPPTEPLPEAPSNTSSTSGRPAWRTWAAAAAGAAAVVVVGAVAIGRGDDGAAVTTDQSGQTGQADEATGQGPGQPGAFGRGVSGSVTEIDGGALTVETTDRSGATSIVTVETSDDTTVTETVEGELSDLVIGDNVLVMGDDIGGGIEATSISETSGDAAFGGGGPPGEGRPDDAEVPEGVDPPEGFDPGDAPQGGGQLPGGFVTGEITAIDGATLTVETPQGESTTVTVTDATTVTVSEERSVDDIEVGDTVRVNGDTEGSVLTATSIQVGDPGFGFGRGGRPGGTEATDANDTSS